MKKTMKKISHIFWAMLVVILAACTEHVDTSNRYVCVEKTIASYLESHEQFSQYYELLSQVKVSKRSETSVRQLLTARGHYSVFAPTNEAIAAYLDTLVAREIITEPSWDSFTDEKQLDSIRKVIVYNSIIDGGDFDYTGHEILYETSTFPSADNEELATATMADRKLTVRHGSVNPDSIWINDECFMSMKNRDIPVINGVIHQMEGVIAPGNDALSALLQSFIDENQEGFIVASRMVLACGMADTLSKLRDEKYEELYQFGILSDLGTHPTERSPGYLPPHRKYGFTLFAETDQFWREAIGKEPIDITLEDISQYLQGQGIYPDAVANENYADENNLINRFITYHMLPVRIPVDKLVIHFNEVGYNPTVGTPGVAMYELYTTMGKRRLLKIFESRESNGVYLNRFPKLDNARRGSYHEVSCDADKVGIFVDRENANVEATNGIIYPIDKLLWYSTETRKNLQRQRLRWDVSGLFPEFLNNDVRGQTVTTAQNMTVGFPCDNDYKYFQDMDLLEGTKFYYLLGRGKGWPNYLADEFNVIGRYELLLRMPPVPEKGTYELRISNSVGVDYRSMCQVYWGPDKDNLPAIGTPLDFRVNGLYRMTDAGNFASSVGWEPDTDDDDYNAEMDKKMRNNGFMKGANIYCAGNPGISNRGRDSYYLTRRIMVTAQMDPDLTYFIRLKNVLDKDDKQLYLDYIELCPKEVYDNPYSPEDVW